MMVAGFVSREPKPVRSRMFYGKWDGQRRKRAIIKLLGIAG